MVSDRHLDIIIEIAAYDMTYLHDYIDLYSETDRLFTSLLQLFVSCNSRPDVIYFILYIVDLPDLQQGSPGFLLPSFLHQPSWALGQP